MANITYKVGVSTDDEIVIERTCFDPEAAIKTIAWATEAIQRARQMPEPANQASLLKALQTAKQQITGKPNQEPPICAVHNVAMQHVQSKKTGVWFWSCHERNADSTWCGYRPPRG